MQPKVKREGGKVWIEGVENFDNIDDGLSHLAAIACVLEYHGEEVDPDWLMGASGEAFCYYYHPDGTFLSQFVHSWDVANAALGAYGFAGKWRSRTEGDVAPALEEIESDVAAGRPVIAPGIMPWVNEINSQCNSWFVVVGVDRAAKTVRVLGAGADEMDTPLPVGDSADPAHHPRWYGILRTFEGIDGHYGPPLADNPILLVQRAGERPDIKDVALQSLHRAVALAREESTVGRFGWGAGTYLSGHAALQRLHDDLLAAQGEGPEEFQRLNPAKGDPFRGLGDELGFLELLSKRRRSAARFLEQAADLLADTARHHLSSAARRFEDSAAEAMKAFEIRHGSDKNKRARIVQIIHDGTFSNSNPEWVAYWSRADELLANSTNRRAMAVHVARVLESEKAAIADIEKALAVLSADSTPAGGTAVRDGKERVGTLLIIHDGDGFRISTPDSPKDAGYLTLLKSAEGPRKIDLALNVKTPAFSDVSKTTLSLDRLQDTFVRLTPLFTTGKGSGIEVSGRPMTVEPHNIRWRAIKNGEGILELDVDGDGKLETTLRVGIDPEGKLWVVVADETE